MILNSVQNGHHLRSPIEILVRVFNLYSLPVVLFSTWHDSVGPLAWSKTFWPAADSVNLHAGNPTIPGAAASSSAKRRSARRARASDA